MNVHAVSRFAGYSLEDAFSTYGVDESSCYYIYFNQSFPGTTHAYEYSCFIYFNLESYDTYYDNSSFENGIYTISFKKGIGSRFAWIQTNNSTGTRYEAKFSNSVSTLVTKIIYDTNTNLLTAFNGSNDVSKNLISITSGLTADDKVNMPVEFLTNFDNLPTPGLNVSVSFNPSLSGALDRKIDQNGVIAESDYFSMNITNNSSNGVQYMFAVVPQGSSVTLNSSLANNNFGFDKSTANGIYYFTSKEWVYAPTLVATNIPGKGSYQYYQSTTWHYLGPSQTFSRSFKWSQIPISKDVEYDAVVVAVPNNVGKASRMFTYPSSTYYVDLSLGKEVYRSSFSVTNPVAYDASDESFGNVPNSGFSDVRDNNNLADGYIDPETGEAVIEKVDLGDSIDAHKDYVPPVISKDLGDLSLSDVSGILSQSQSFFHFLQLYFHGCLVGFGH